VLLAYSTAGIVALLPLTPGGLGIVEASMSGLLILAGVHVTYTFLATLATGSPPTGSPSSPGRRPTLLFRLRYGRPVPRRATPGGGGQPSAGGQAQ
jgi:hypothetical protein